MEDSVGHYGKIKENKMKVALCCDHGGLALKNAIVGRLKDFGCEAVDYGTTTCDSCAPPCRFIEYKASRAVDCLELNESILIVKSMRARNFYLYNGNRHQYCRKQSKGSSLCSLHRSALRPIDART